MFVNRVTELSRLRKALTADKPQFVVMYGRRRCGKSSLIRQLLDEKSVYFCADMRETTLQIASLSLAIDNLVPGFAAPHYTDWVTFFRSLNMTLKNRINIFIDEFPYLVKNSPELPSVLQNILDNRDNLMFNLVICGSSQMMMKGLVLNSAAPLYGRAGEIMKINPMSVSHMQKYIGLSATAAIAEYGIWGGVPRYWELRKEAGSFQAALEHHIFNPYGILMEEPERLFSDEIRTSVQAYTILTLIGAGCHRTSELAARMEKPATHISGVLSFLTDLKYIRREIPFGESPRSGKKSLYKIDDPFLNFWFTFIAPEKSRIHMGLGKGVLEKVFKNLPHYTSGVWEELCRQAVPFLHEKYRFDEARRWWGNGLDGRPMEVDLVALSHDQKYLAVGEVKWSAKPSAEQLTRLLTDKAANLPFAAKYRIVPILFLKQKPSSVPAGVLVFRPEDVVNVL
ncbi:MAG: ATP-binding protein [Bacteroidales bacterium]|nr:ATP-binding protein [Bacteroidales bacterium]